jgi:hypothetical protein
VCWRSLEPDHHESWAFLDGVQIVDEKGDPLKVQGPEQRAVKSGVGALPPATSPNRKPTKFVKKRSEELQAYAKAIIDTILA